MKYNLCTISFRHQLVSLRELVVFANKTGYTGIELWGVHARSLIRHDPIGLARLVPEMQRLQIEVGMISDYLDLLTPEGFEEQEAKWKELLSLARLFQTNKLRIFAGNRASESASREEWERCMKRLRDLADMSSAYGIYLIVETHPMTYADCLPSVLKLLEDTDHPYIRLNLDFLHMWEADCSPEEAYRKLKPWVHHFHFKNVRDRDSLSVFAPDNVYSPSGHRQGIVSLSEGALSFSEIVKLLELDQTPFSASIEWFGDDPYHQLKEEMRWLRQVEDEIGKTVTRIG
ncbi:Xylose isomerase domain protein TIM barrel [Paenibacillus curdlanolyticus YK9]|uniref:Xylose isomerase domain protein TIM barrel n=1 Tax=Paenibacillus curdlanolyticus YK9 TaxID=717606 RepID=E0I5C2_9BACL|nr:sugar phosphate isomerase/epimerase [Paenibacillus curdlanolyticus]EFM12164.1 Xylose isomerase domain protein TIM barrel [Paenibacillus curdlanolyticus YK9]